MAFQHGRLLRYAIAHGSVVEASRLAANGVRSSLGVGALAHLVSWYSRAAIADCLRPTKVNRIGRASF